MIKVIKLKRQIFNKIKLLRLGYKRKEAGILCNKLELVYPNNCINLETRVVNLTTILLCDYEGFLKQYFDVMYLFL